MKTLSFVVVAVSITNVLAAVSFPGRANTEKVNSKTWSWIEVLTIPVPSSLYDNERAERAKNETRDWGLVYWDLDYWQETLLEYSITDDKIW
jgi:hypothetical protein